MGDTLLFTTETSFNVLSQGSAKYPTSLTLTSNDLLERIATTIPLLCLGLLGFAVATCLFVTERLALPASSVIGAIIFAFIAALLDFSQVLLRSNGGAASTTLNGFSVAEEVFLVVTLVFTFCFYLSYLGRPPYGELDRVPQNKRKEARKQSPASWGASGFPGSLAYVVLAGAIFTLAILQVMWRLFAIPPNGVYLADGIVQIILYVAFFVKLWLNVWSSPLTPRWKTFRNYAPVTLSLLVGLTSAILNLVMCEFSESSLGRFLQAVQLYILATFVLITPFYRLKRSAEQSDISPGLSSFQGLNPRNSTGTGFRVSPRTIPPVPPVTVVSPTRLTTERRSAPERISTWFQRNIQVQNRRDPLQARLWNADGSERDIEVASPSPNAIPTADDSSLDARFTGEPLAVKWLDPAYNTPRDERTLAMAPEVKPGPSQEIPLPTKTRSGSLPLSGRKIQAPPSPTGLPPRPLPAIPTGAPPATRPMDSFGPYKLETPKAERSSRTLMPYYPPPRRPVSDGYPLSLNSTKGNATGPRRALPLPPLSRPNAEVDAPARPATWATQDAFAQIDAVLRDGLLTPLVVERRSSSGSSKRNSYDSGLARLKKEQEELDRSIAELNMFSTSQNPSYFAQQQNLPVASGRPQRPTLTVPPGPRRGSNGEGEHSSVNEAISSSGVSSSGAFALKSGSYKSEFSLSNFPSPPVVTFRASSYYPERNSVFAAATNASTPSGTSSGSQGTATMAPYVRKKRPMTVSASNTIVPDVSKDKGKDKGKLAEPPTVDGPETPEGEETDFWEFPLLRKTPEVRGDGNLANLPSNFQNSRASSTSSGQQVAGIVSSYTKRGSDGSTIIGQGALKAGKRLDVTSFIGELMLPEDAMAPPRRPWLSKSGDRLSTDSQDLSAAEIIRARATTVAPAVKIATSQAISLPPPRPTSQRPGRQPPTPTSRPPLQSVMRKPSIGLPSSVAPARSRPLPPPTLPTPLTNPPPNASRLPQTLPRRGAMVTPQTGRPLSRQVSNPSTGETSATLQGQLSTPVTAVSTMSNMQSMTRVASKDKDRDKDKDKDKADSRPGTPPALPALPAPVLPAPVGIARILAEMTDEIENASSMREKKPDTRKLRTPPFPARRSGPGIRPQRF